MKKLVMLAVAIFLTMGCSLRCFAVGAEAAALIEFESGRVLFEQNGGARLPMASTTKIMTALLTLEQGGLDVPFKVDGRAIAVEGSSMGLQKGDTATLRALAAGMLLASGNDAANAAAVRISGTVEDFVKRMNLRAAELGLANTSFATPSGLDGEGHYSSAVDMALLAREALAIPEFAELCAAKSLPLEYGDPPYRRWLTNHNRLLECCEGANGVKTGFTKKAGRCLVSSVTRGGTTLIFVTLNCPDDWDEHIAVYDEYFARLKPTELSQYAGELGAAVSGGEKDSAALAVDKVSAGLMEGELGRVTVEYELARELVAPVTAGDIAGRALFFLDGVKIAEAKVRAAESIKEIEKERGAIDIILDFLERAGFR